MDEMPRGALLSHRLRGEGGGANHQRGPLFHRPTGKSACFPTGESPVVKVLSKLAPLLFEGHLPPPSRRRPVHYKTAVRRDALRFCLGKNYMDRDIAASGSARPVLSTDSSFPFREALIKSLSDFILVFLFNARNKSTRTASYLRRLMTKHWIKILMKFDSANESVLS